MKRLGGTGSTARPADRAEVARFYAVVLSIDLYAPAARQASGYVFSTTNPHFCLRCHPRGRN